MDAVVQRILGNVKLGEARSAGALTVLPLFGDLPLGPDYITLAEAMAVGALQVTELDEAGVVGRLTAHNAGKKPVLIIDGEELAGAKQNRVLNTSVLIAAGATIDLPVSCTERGRWAYSSARFEDSGNLLAHAVRARSHRSVTANVRGREAYASDQGAVWAGVEDMMRAAAVASPTHAMRDVVEHKRADVDGLVGGFVPEPEQRGLLALVGGRVVGFDLVSRPAAYAVLHERILGSYALEATLSDRTADPAADTKRAKAWMVSLADLESTVHDSPGMGRSHRFTAHGLAGAALTYRDAIVHAAFLTAAEPPQPPLRRQRPRL